jgi:site-specific DNA-methyltransferase (adenine-specific)
MVCAIEDAGFEIRDQIGWLYGSGFAKSHNLKGEHEGLGSALNPAMEPIVVARKPLVGTIAENVAQFRVGALNIDACRIAVDGELVRRKGSGTTFSKIHHHEGRVAPAGREGQASANRRYREKGATNFAATPGRVAIRSGDGQQISSTMEAMSWCHFSLLRLARQRASRERKHLL